MQTLLFASVGAAVIAVVVASVLIRRRRTKAPNPRSNGYAKPNDSGALR